MTWKEKISTGLNLIIEGCKENTEWHNCHECPFEILCDSIFGDSETPYSTPDCYEEEGYFNKEKIKKKMNKP